MQKIVYTWNGSGYDSDVATWYSLFECKNRLNRAADPADSKLQEMIAAYVAYDPNNDVVNAWIIGSADKKAELEAQYPWLTNPDSRPADDPSAREAEVQDMVQDWSWRRFKAARAGAVSKIVVTRDRDGTEFDGDEASQARMSRVVFQGNAAALVSALETLSSAEADPSCTAQSLAAALRQSMKSALDSISVPWKTANNETDQISYYDAVELCRKAGIEQTTLWFQ